MVRILGATLMMENIMLTKNDFFSMSPEDRIKFIQKYELLLPYQKTALLQCRKFMSPAEKREYKKVRDAASLKAENKTVEPEQLGG